MMKASLPFELKDYRSQEIPKWGNKQEQIDSDSEIGALISYSKPDKV